MEIQREGLERRIAVATGREPADLVITNCQVADLFQLEWFEGDVAIVDGMIVGIGHYEGKDVLDGGGRYLIPALMDGHVHIESSTVTPPQFAEVLLQHGVTAAICDPHEIANVAGVEGIQYMLDASEDLPVDLYFMLPSCVPATPWEESGAVLTAEDLAPFYQHPRVLGLGEVMDYPAVATGEKGMIDKLFLTLQQGGVIDGHGAGLSEEGLNLYRALHIMTDHEATSLAEAKARLQRGFYLLMREGSGARNLRSLLQVVTPTNARRILFCTDDKHLDELVEEGSIDHHVRLAIAEGMEPLQAIQIATLNGAECYGLKERGAVAPGYRADLLLVDDLEAFSISMVLKDGKVLLDRRRDLQPQFGETSVQPPAAIRHSLHLPALTSQQLQIPADKASFAHVMEVIPGQLITNHRLEAVESEAGFFQPSTRLDQLKLAVIERHRGSGHVGLGIVKGFGMKRGAIASTVGHDSHNLLLLGTNDRDMLRAVEEMRRIEGGLVVVAAGEVLATLSLPVAGLMSQRSVSALLPIWKRLDEALHQLQFAPGINPFLLLSFLSLPVIPQLKLTTQGLFDVEKGRWIELIEQRERAIGQ